MKLRILLILMVFPYINNFSQEISLYPVNHIKIESKLDTVLNLFIKEIKCDSCIIEIYIDKINDWHHIITIKTNYFKVNCQNDIQPALLYFYKKKHLFIIYTGVEDYFIGDRNQLNITIKKSDNYLKIWTFEMKNGKYQLFKHGTWPPVVKPDFEINDIDTLDKRNM